jgi:tetratricopeptide (TPR) repeat protein
MRGRAMDADDGLLEREAVATSTADLVDRVAAGGVGALFVVGEAGLGKTSVIEQAWRRAAAAGLAVGLGRGHPMEAGLPFGVLARALDSSGGPGLLGEDDIDFQSAADWPRRYYRVLRWLERRAGSPVFLALDDPHWADADSVALMSFLCRRMDAVPFGLIAGMRPWPAAACEAVAELMHEGHGAVLRLLPLSQHAAGTLLQALLGRRVPAAVRRRAFELSAGNPLLLRQLAVAMEKCAGVPDAASAGMTAMAFGQGVLLSRFAGLPPEGMRCAQAASVLGSRFVPEIAAQIAGLDEADVDPAVEALARTGLIEQRPGAAAEFVHPLFRQALYDDLPGPVRARLHARAFGALHARGLDAQAAEHAVRSGMTGDTEAVVVLEAAGRAARRAGAMATAVSWLDKAAMMAGDRASVRLLLDLAEARLASGGAEHAIAIYQSLLTRSGLEPAVRVEAHWMLARALAAVTAASSLAELVPFLDAWVCVGRAWLCLYMADLAESARLCERAESIAAARGQLIAELFLWEVRGHRRLREGAIAGACAAYDRLGDITRRMGVREPCLPPWARHAMSAYLAAGRVADAERILGWLDEMVPRLPCTFPRIAAATGRAQLAEFRGDRDGAHSHYRSALALHDEVDLPIEHCETLLAYGGFLRRAGWATRARPVLARAAQVAQGAGALWLAGFAHAELKVAGGRLRRHAPPGTLSPQEERVAALVAVGAANADIARQLCLSVSTACQ